MKARGWLLGGSPAQATAAACLATAALALPLLAVLADLPSPSAAWGVAALGFAHLGLTSSLIAALRLRRPAGDRQRQLIREVAAGVLLLAAGWLACGLLTVLGLAVLAPGLGATLYGPGGPAAPLSGPLTALIFASFWAVGAAAGYPPVRLLALAWPIWDRLQRTHLLWALTHAQLKAALLLTLIAVAMLAPLAYLSADVRELLPATASPTAPLGRLVLLLLPAGTALLLAGVGAILLVLPPVALVSYLALRGSVRRLEQLADGTRALRGGDLEARVAVAGQDEIAQLQADFNAMAADLERAMGDLEAERDTVARLLRAQRELVIAASHELRTPVATLRAYLEAMLARRAGIHGDGGTEQAASDGAALTQDLAVMARQTEGLQRLIDDLFTLVRAEAGGLPLERRPTDIGALLRRCAAAAGPMAWQRGRVELRAEAPPDLPPALIDADRLEGMLGNLIVNAVRHTPPGGLVMLTAAVDTGALHIEVRDTGEGIAPADLPHIFERFYRADRARGRDQGGAGIGLALVKELSEAMGGSVAVESAPGQGSTFRLRLPLV